MTSSTIAGGVFGASFAALPSAFDRPAIVPSRDLKAMIGSARVPKLGLVGLVAGGALGAAAAGVTNLTGMDGVTGGAAIAGVGVLGAVAGGMRPAGFLLRDSGSILKSVGMMTAAGGGAVAATSVLRSSDTPVVDSKAGAGVLSGLGGGAVALGSLAAMGALRRAPSVEAAARTVLEPVAGSLEGITPATAKAFMAERNATAKQALEGLPSLTDDPWSDVGKGKGFLRGVATTEEIAQTMGEPAVRQPTRVYTGVAESADPEQRVQLTLDRVKAALARENYGMIHLISPDAEGGTAEMLPLAVEHGRKGDVLSVMMQTTSSTPNKAFFQTESMSQQYEQLLRGIKQQIDELPEGQPRPTIGVSGLCLGTVPIYKVRARNGGSLSELGVSNTVLPVGPAMAREVRTLAGQIDRGEAAGMRLQSRDDVLAALDRGVETPEVLVRTLRDDQRRIAPIHMLVPPTLREDQQFVPVMTAVSNFLDFMLDKPRDGRMLEVGHRVEASAVADANLGFGLGMTREQMDAVDQAGVRFNAIRGISRQRPAEA